MEVAQVTDTEDDIREFARITPVDAAPEHKAAAGVAPAGRARHLPGNGHPLMPPWQVAESGPDEVTMQGHFTRFHVGGNGAVHGGVLPLFYDWQFGMVVSAAGRPDSRTAYLHVDYRKITPTDRRWCRGRVSTLSTGEKWL